MYAIYGDIYHQYTPVMLAYIPAPWIRHGHGTWIRHGHGTSILRDPSASEISNAGQVLGSNAAFMPIKLTSLLSPVSRDVMFFFLMVCAVMLSLNSGAMG